MGSIRPTDVSLALQTVVTAWPLDVDRLHDYLVKATREAHVATTWTRPDDRYEADLRDLAITLVDETADSDSSLGRFAGELVRPGSAIGLRLLALQLTCPGVPDLYQGAPRELLSLVDPDNRRGAPWTAWAHLIDGAGTRGGALDVADPDEARTLLVARVLDARRRHAEAFGADAGYRPVGVNGPDAGRVIAFARLDADGRPAMITVVVRPSSSSALDATVDIADGSWHDLVHATPVADDPTDVATLTGFVGVAVLRRG
jgi:maltooligosyltrehalose synthase